MYEYDTSLIFMPINLLQKFLDNNGQIDHYEIIVNNFNDLELIKSHLRQIIPDYLRIVDWRELNPSLFNAIEVRNVMFLILLLIIIVAAFNLISSMMILVSNKKRYWSFKSTRYFKISAFKNFYFEWFFNWVFGNYSWCRYRIIILCKYK